MVIYFLFFMLFDFKFYLDINMESPPALPALQGASRVTGGVFRGKAYGNVVNHADFPDLVADTVPTTVDPKFSFKILAHVEYGDAFLVNLAPDFTVELPITVFFLTGISLLAQPLLKKAAQLHDKITSKSTDNFIKYIDIYFLLKHHMFSFTQIFLANGFGLYKENMPLFLRKMKRFPFKSMIKDAMNVASYL